MDKDIGYILHKAAMFSKNDFSNKLNVIGITPGQFAVLREIYYHQKCTIDLGLSPACIAARLECDRPTISGVIDRLEAQKWVERLDNPDDKRSFLIKVTNKAMDKLEELEGIYSNTCNTIIKGFSEEEIIIFKNNLLRVVKNFKEVE